MKKKRDNLPAEFNIDLTPIRNTLATTLNRLENRDPLLTMQEAQLIAHLSQVYVNTVLAEHYYNKRRRPIAVKSIEILPDPPPTTVVVS